MVKQLDGDIQTITCNCCGRTYTITGNHQADMVNLNQFQDVNWYYGYGSKRDKQSVNFHLCEKCQEGIMQTFTIKPYIVEDTLNDIEGCI